MTSLQINLPSDIPMPKFLIGQLVEAQNQDDYKADVRGHIVGMRYTSRDAALAASTYPGWDYVIEVDPFEHSHKPHYSLCEDDIQPISSLEAVA